ncbi:Nn.00g008170.m01.CDS01 [Neocucurbitaria sp. VM-36]
MLGSYVCRQCRARLSRRAVPIRTPQWQPRATFLSLRTPKSQNNAEPTPTAEQSSAQSQPEAAPDESQNGPRIQYTSIGGPQQGRRAGRYSRHVHDRIEGSLQPPPTFSENAEEGETGSAAAQVPLETGNGYAQSIEAALSNGRVGQAWSLFEKNYTSRDCKALTDPPLGDVALLNNGKIFVHLLNSVNAAFCKGQTNLAVTPTVALFRLEQLGLARPEYWARQTLSYLTYQAIQTVNATTKKPQRDLPSLLSELLSVWRLFFQCMGRKGSSLEAVSTDWQLPATGALPEMHESMNFSMRLQEHHPKYVGNSTLGFCAVYLYTISDALNSNESLQQQAAPFLRFLEHLLAGSYVSPVFKHVEQSNTFNELPPEVQKQIKKEIDSAPQKAILMIGSKGETLGPEDTGDAAANLEAFYLKRIARAVESRSSASVLDNLWGQVEKAYTPQGQNVTIPSRIYNAFLSGFMVLLHSQRSVDVWNHMIAHGVKPDMQSWVALLEGCAKAKDLNGLNAMWTRMLSTGVEPDNYAWTTRVNGLFALRQVNLGLAALDDMGRRWLSAENMVNSSQTHSKNRKGSGNLSKSSKAVNNYTKPSIEVINGAISALVQIRRESMTHDKRIEFVQKILGWARNFDIKPDARTYNSLIQLYLRAGDYATAFKVLRQMEKDGIEGDIATHTMLITAAFDNQTFDHLSAAEQTERILSLFNNLEAGGMKMNDYVYATAIDRLLKQYSNYNAVRAIMDHMTSREMVPSAHAYTSLITHYFQQTPPAIAAIDSLVLQIFTSHRMPNDRIMFDRLIEGYATHGEVGKMMSVLTKMSKHGKLPGWSALTAVVKALVQDGDTERARAVVRDVELGEGVAKGGITGGSTGERAFFSMVRRFGIGLDEERMGDVLSADRAVRASDDEAIVGQQMHEQEIQQMTRKEEAQEVVEEEEDVHGFLKDELEAEHRGTQRL